MSRLHGVKRGATLFCVVATFLMIGFVAGTGSVGADPYPPLLPTGQVPAVATVPAPQVGGSASDGGIRNNADSVIIAPGSYPVQARTGAGPNPETSHPPAALAATAVVVFAGILSAFYMVRRTRRTR